MTDKSRKPEDHSGAAKRGHTPNHQHHQLTPTPTPGFYAIGTSTDMSRHAPPHHHLSAYLAPSYMPHPLTIQGPIPPGAGRPPTISNDLGPPIFMPSLNLGTPKPATTKGHKMSNAVTSSQVSHDTSSPSGEFPPPIISPYPNATNIVKTTYSGIKMSSGQINSIKKGKIELGSKSVHPHTVAMRHVERNSPSPSSFPNTTSIGMSLVKPVNSVSSDASGGYATPTSHYHVSYGGVVMMGGAKPDVKGFVKSSETGFDKQDPGSVTVMTLASGMSGGATLVCNERLSPPLPHTTTSSTATGSQSNTTVVHSNEQHRYDRAPTINHYPPTTDSANSMSTGDSIPWPEAMSKSIIIPAPNLTGKDIANLTSSASSSPLSNDKGNIDGHWPTTPTDPPFSDELSRDMAEGHSPPLSSSHNHLLVSSSTNNSTHVFSGGGISHMIQQGSSSPRPSILRKRPLDRSSDTLLSPSSSTTSHTHMPRLPSSSTKPNLICHEHSSSLHDNHMMCGAGGDFVSSPRKRPRKQQFDSINNTHSPSSSSISNSNNNLNNKLPSMMSHERLSGPFSYKPKDRYFEREERSGKELDKLYISQLRKPQYPIGHLSKKSHKSTFNHFRRHADIKHHEEQPVSLQETCNAENTWLRSSGWKLNHLNSHLTEIEDSENDTLQVIVDLECVASEVLKSLPEGSLTDSNHKFMEKLIEDTKERNKRSLLHIHETKQSMLKILETNKKVIEIMKKFSTNLPVTPSLTSTAVSLSPPPPNNTQQD